MKEIIKIKDCNGRKVVSAKELYIKLGYNKAHWAKWYKKNIENNEYAIEFEDWEGFTLSVNGNRSQDFALSIDFAKKICMKSNTPKGEDIRKYFIDTEKRLQTAQQGISNIMQDPIISMRVKQLEIENRVKELEAKTTTRPDYYTIAGFGSLVGISINYSQASSLGRQVSTICKQRGIETDTTPDPRFGKVNTYPKTILQEVFNIAMPKQTSFIN